MRRVITVVFLSLISGLVVAQTRGPIVDKVYIDVRMNEGIGLMDTANGRTDVFFWGVTGAQYRALPAAVRKNLDIYRIPSGTWSLLLNPVPNQAPYTWTHDGRTDFNPLAIRKVRYALNWLINRQYIVNEILGGEGAPMFTPMTPGQPGTYRYNLLAFKLGMTPQGDEKKALQMIAAAMQRAADLPANRGKLVRKGRFWCYNGKPITLKFLIRVDDPEGRLREGHYIANQIEKAGLKVQRLEWDRAKCIRTCSYGDPGRLEWHLYTEGWGAGATRAYWDIVLAQMLAPWYGNMPGAGNPNFWNYHQEEIDRLSKKIFNGNFLTKEEYWRANLRATQLGLQEAVRIYIALQQEYYVANKARFNSRMIYGVGDGLNNWSLVTADVKPTNGQKVLHITQYSAKGALFMSAWDPVGINGFSDSYTRVVSDPMCDMASFEAPHSGLDTPWRVQWHDVVSKVVRVKDAKGQEVLRGQIPVPAEAVRYDSQTKSWQTVGKGHKTFSRATYTYRFGKWHHGRAIGIADVLYAHAFMIEWMNQDGADDKYYEPTYAKLARPQQLIRAIMVHPDKSVTTYFDYNFPLSQDRVGATGTLWLSTLPSGISVCVPWEINEALAQLVAEGHAASGTLYRFCSTPGFTEVDLINPTCIADIRAQLVALQKRGYVPACLRDFITPAQARQAYATTIAFIDQHHHAFISNGPFLLESFNSQNNMVVLGAFRDPAYPFAPGYWKQQFQSMRTRIDNVRKPIISRLRGGKVRISVSEVEYPENCAHPSRRAHVEVILLTPQGEKHYQARQIHARPGLYEWRVPVKDVRKLRPGSYQVVIKSCLAQEAPALTTVTIFVF